MTGRSRSLIILLLLTTVIVGGLLGAWWFRGSAQQPMTVAQIDRAALSAGDPLEQWWTARDSRTALPEASNDALIFEAMVLPRLSPQVSDVWAQVRELETAQIASLPVSGGTSQSSAQLRTALQSLMTDFARMAAAYDLINATHYRAAIDDWWAPYPQAQVFPVLASGYRETLLAGLPREDITPTHLQMGDVMAQRQRRLGWAAQAEVDAIASALRERLDAERVAHEAHLQTELTTQLTAIELGSEMKSVSASDMPSTILSSHGALPALTLGAEFNDLIAVHAAQMPAMTSRNLLAASSEESTALQQLWEAYVALRERRIDAALRGQRITEGTGPDMTQQVAEQLFSTSATPATAGEDSH